MADPTPNTGQASTITILHLNDVYNIEPCDKEGYVSGAARVAGIIHSQEADKPLVLFSGDAFSPSIMSTITLGQHMPPVLNKMNIKAACIGNHDFDMGLATAQALVRQCSFPWLMSNVVDRTTGTMVPGLHETLMIEHEGVKVGVMGLVEGEWLETLGAVDPDVLEYRDFVQEGQRLAEQLKAQGADLVVAITHMRVPNDRLLAASVPGIDLVLGGHDHHYEVDYIAPYNTLMVKSGTDFRDVTRISVTLPPGGGKPQLTWVRQSVQLDSPIHAPTAEVVAHYAKVMGSRLDEVIGHLGCPLDSRFTTIRLAESNMGNMVCDILRAATGADVVVINAGTLRSDQVHQEGPFRVRDLVSLLPMPDGLLTVEATGKQILEVLENGVSQVPRLEGRFPQVSGIRFQYDSSKPAGSRVIPDSVHVLKRQGPAEGALHSAQDEGQQGSDSEDELAGLAQQEVWEPLDLTGNRVYTLGVKTYMAEGKDGYDVLLECKQITDEELALVLPTTIRNYFRSLQVLNIWDPKVKASAAFRKWRVNAHSRHASKQKLHTDEPATVPEEHELSDDEADPVMDATARLKGVHLGAGHGQQPGEGAQATVTAAPHTELGLGPQSPCVRRELLQRAKTLVPCRARPVKGSSLCVLVPDYGYSVKPEVEGRIVDVAQPSAS